MLPAPIVSLKDVKLSLTSRAGLVEILRGVPMLVILYYIAFVGAPGLAHGINAVGHWLAGAGPLAGLGRALSSFQVRDLDFTTRAIIALTLGYSAFIAEIFRAGIQSIGRGQMEAARSLGMSYRQAMETIILPQAVRTVLPPLGNDLIAMLKDSSLVSVLGVGDVAQRGGKRGVLATENPHAVLCGKPRNNTSHGFKSAERLNLSCVRPPSLTHRPRSSRTSTRRLM